MNPKAIEERLPWMRLRPDSVVPSKSDLPSTASVPVGNRAQVGAEQSNAGNRRATWNSEENWLEFAPDSSENGDPVVTASVVSCSTLDQEN